MADGTKIEWTDATWNPITGCSVVSPGCTNCYAMKLAGTRLKHHPSREGLTRDSKAGPVWTGEVRFNPDWLDQPLRWKKPRMIFVCAHGDLFAPGVKDEWLDQIFSVMSMAPQHTFQVLTKRPERMRDYLTGKLLEHRFAATQVKFKFPIPSPSRWPHMPLPNVWLGVSVEDQQRADERIPILLDTPAAIRWISAEPLLGPVDLTRINQPNDGFGPYWINALEAGEAGWFHDEGATIRTAADPLAFSGLARLDWVVAGGESGDGARPMHPDWPRALRNQCAVTGVPFLFKQWGNWLGGEWEDLGDQGHLKAADRDGHYVPYRRRDKHEHWFEPDHWPDGPGAVRMHKADAGRLLDGVEHNGFPK